jgi:hypothetical protein
VHHLTVLADGRSPDAGGQCHVCAGVDHGAVLPEHAEPQQAGHADRAPRRPSAARSEELTLVYLRDGRDPARILVERRDRDDVIQACAGELADLLDAVERVARLAGVVTGGVDVAVGVASVHAGHEQDVTLAASGRRREVAPPRDRVRDDAPLRRVTQVRYGGQRHERSRHRQCGHGHRRPGREVAAEALAADFEDRLDGPRVRVKRHEVDHVAQAAACRLEQVGERFERRAGLPAHVPRRRGRRRLGRRAEASYEDQLAHLSHHARRRHEPSTTASA